MDLAMQMEQESAPSPQDLKAAELAGRYHREAEAYDRTVCTGPVIRGEILPVGPRELALINRHAGQLYRQIMAEAMAHGISRPHMARLISNHRT